MIVYAYKQLFHEMQYKLKAPDLKCIMFVYLHVFFQHVFA